MVNRGIKQRLHQPVRPGRPAGVFKNPAGVPAQQYYKILRHSANEQKIAFQSQMLQRAKQQTAQQNSPDAYERRVTFSSDIATDGSMNW